MARLHSFRSSPRQLADPELFMLLLTEVPRWELEGPMHWGGSRAPGSPVPPPTHPALTSSYAQRLELLVLKEDFFPRLSALRSSIQTLTDAAIGERHCRVCQDRGVGGHRPCPHSPLCRCPELLECEELHTILHLILSAGNHLNSVSPWHRGPAACPLLPLAQRGRGNSPALLPGRLRWQRCWLPPRLAAEAA